MYHPALTQAVTSSVTSSWILATVQCGIPRSPRRDPWLPVNAPMPAMSVCRPESESGAPGSSRGSEVLCTPCRSAAEQTPSQAAQPGAVTQALAAAGPVLSDPWLPASSGSPCGSRPQKPPEQYSPGVRFVLTVEVGRRVPGKGVLLQVVSWGQDDVLLQVIFG